MVHTFAACMMRKTWCIRLDALLDVLQDSPNKSGIMSSKASGEPCIMVSVSVIQALQAAAAAAAKEIETGGPTIAEPQGVFTALSAPATPSKVRAAIGAFWAADIVAAAL
jgi:xanthine dehydrogenase molybdopterin-binding subunit B